MRILVVSLQGIGNTALLLPVMHRLAFKNKSPVDIVVSNNGSDQLLLNNPDIGRVYLWKEAETGLKNLFRLGKELRTERYDLAYAAFPNWTRENAVALMARARWKSGYAGDERYLLDRLLCGACGLTRKRPVKRHDMASNLDLFGLDHAPAELTGRALYYSEQETSSNRELLRKHLGEGEFQLAGLHPGSKAAEKRWPEERFGEFAVRLAEKYRRVKFLVFGSAGEKKEMLALFGVLGERAVLLDGLSLRQTAWFISRCAVFVGNDSAPAHLAALQGVPTIAITGPADYLRTSPVGKKSIVIRKDLECSPCYSKVRDIRRECRFGLKCIKEIAAAEVFGVADKCLEAIIAARPGSDSAGIWADPAKVRREDLFSGAAAFNLKERE